MDKKTGGTWRRSLCSGLGILRNTSENLFDRERPPAPPFLGGNSPLIQIIGDGREALASSVELGHFANNPLLLRILDQPTARPVPPVGCNPQVSFRLIDAEFAQLLLKV